MADFFQYRTINASRLAEIIKESNKNGIRFCFILGSGASAESGIDTGNKLEMDWMNCLMGIKSDLGSSPLNPDVTRETARKLKDADILKHGFDEIEADWESAVSAKKDYLPSKYYFDIYKLRFFPDSRNGYRYMEKIMDNCFPSPGYHALTKLMTEPTSEPKSDVPLNNLVITTNFDSLAEDALFLYSKRKPLVVAHEALAGFMGTDTNRPIVAKVHRGVHFHPLNSPEETAGLKAQWEPTLQYAFNVYTPIVIGYGGGDSSLMKFLKEEAALKAVYWCFLREYGIPEDENIRTFVKKSNGCFVSIEGFDSLMAILGENLYGRSVFPDETENYLVSQAKEQARTYRDNWKKLQAEPEVSTALASTEEELKKEAEKRADDGTSTSWDYALLGNEAMDKGAYNQAIEAYEKALELDPENVAVYNNLGVACYHLGNFEMSLQSIEKALAIREKVLPEDHPDLAASYNNIGTIYGELGDYRKALEYQEKALRIREKVLPEDHPELAASYNNVGSTYGDLGDHKKALEYQEKALRIREKVLPEDHPDLATSYNNVGSTYGALGDHEKELGYLLKAFAILERVLPVGHSNVQIVCGNIAVTYEELGDTENAKIWRDKLKSMEDS